ncbi:MAG: hypothetical protein GC168_17325 [Candidatus Hydrogenedens sp.]|nr:hypothetical protein [Candidatus Hydrogenedens sp.]
MRGFLIFLLCVALLAQIAFVLTRTQGDGDASSAAPAATQSQAAGPGLSALLTPSQSERSVNEGRPPKHGKEQLRGVVTDAAGAPAPGVNILAVERDASRWNVYRGPGNEKRWPAVTDASGTFVLDTLPAGGFAVAAFDAQGFALDMAEITAGHPADIVLQLAPHFSLSGTVADTAGEPVEEAHVYALYGAADNNGPWTYWPATTDKNGRFAFHRMNNRPRALLAVREDETSAVLELAPDAATSGLALAFGQDGELAGYVTQADDQRPARKTRLLLTEALYGLETHTVFSGGGGAFEFAGIRPAVYRLTMDSSQYVMTETPEPVLIAPDSRSKIEVLVEQGARVRGSVIGQDPRQRIESQTVRLVPLDDSLPEMTVLTGATGVYQFHPVPRGKYSVVLADAAGALVEGSREIEVGEDKRVAGPTFQVEPGVSIRGTVATAAREPAVDATVYVRSDSIRGFERVVSTADDGAFHVENVPVGEPVRIWAESLDRSSTPYVSNGVPAGGIESLSFSLTLSNRGRIEGAVVDAQGAPVPGAVVACYPEQISTAEQWTATAGPDGAFVLDHLTEGTYRLLAGIEVRSLDETTQRRIVLEVGQQAGGVTLTLAGQAS